MCAFEREPSTNAAQVTCTATEVRKATEPPRWLPRLEEITIGELISKGYTEDRVAKKQFDTKIFLRLAPFIASFFASLVLCVVINRDVAEINRSVAVFVAAAGPFLGILVVLFVAYRSPILSRHTGKPMVQYKNTQLSDRVSLETLYVCPDGKTYFSRAWRVNSGGEVAMAGSRCPRQRVIFARQRRD